MSTTNKTGAVALEWKYQPTQAHGKVAYQLTAAPRGLGGGKINTRTSEESREMRLKVPADRPVEDEYGYRAMGHLCLGSLAQRDCRRITYMRPEHVKQ